MNYPSKRNEIHDKQIETLSFICDALISVIKQVGSSWPRSYGSWIYNYLFNQCLSPLMLWVWNLIRVRCTTLCDKVCEWLAKGRWFSLGPTVSSTNKTERHDITEIFLKVALNTIKQTNKQTNNIKQVSDLSAISMTSSREFM